MASVVQFKVATGTGAASYDIVLDAPAAVGNDVILLSYSDAGTHGAAETFGGTDMETLQDFEFTLGRWSRLRVASSGQTTCTVTMGATTNWRGILLEVSGLTNAGAVDANSGSSPVASGEGSATSHTLEYTNSGSNRFGLALAWNGGQNGTITGANGATAIEIQQSGGSTFALLYKDALASGAGSIDLTISAARTISYALISLPAEAGGAAPLRMTLLGVG